MGFSNEFVPARVSLHGPLAGNRSAASSWTRPASGYDPSVESIDIPEISPTTRLVSLPALVLSDAVTSAPPELPTRLRLARRDGLLLVRYDCRHRGIVATLTRDNDPLWKEDAVEAFLSFEDPPRRYLELEANPLGARFSAWVTWSGDFVPTSPPALATPSPHGEGDRGVRLGLRACMAVETFDFPGFEASVRVHPRRWSALLRVPLPAPLPAALRANFFRIDRKAGEFSALFPPRRDPPDFHVPEAFGLFRWHRS
jgi:hypothetical protein